MLLNPNDAISGLMERFQLSEIQSRAIVEMRLRQLTGLMQDQLHAEYEEIQKQIAYLEEILVNDELCRKVIKDELIEVKRSMVTNVARKLSIHQKNSIRKTSMQMMK